VNLMKSTPKCLSESHRIAPVFGRSQRYAIEGGLLGLTEERARTIDARSEQGPRAMSFRKLSLVARSPPISRTPVTC
jgi:hypothetical protein